MYNKYPVKAHRGITIWVAKDLQHLEQVIKDYYEEKQYDENDNAIYSLKEFVRYPEQVYTTVPGNAARFLF